MRRQSHMLISTFFFFFLNHCLFSCVANHMVENGNTHVTCHVGVPSCGQRHRNVFIALLLTCTITNTIINDSLASPPCASSPAPLFLCPPSHSCIICQLASQTQPGRGGSVERVHPPSPSSFAPWSSRRQVDYSHAPCRLPG